MIVDSLQFDCESCQQNRAMRAELIRILDMFPELRATMPGMTAPDITKDLAPAVAALADAFAESKASNKTLRDKMARMGTAIARAQRALSYQDREES